MHSFDDFRAIVQADQPLAPHVWFRLGGPARFLARPHTLEELLGLLRRCRDEQLPFRLLSGGSNVLVRDQGVEAMVIHLESPAFSDVSIADNVVLAGAAVPLTALISHSARAGLTGLEVLTGIPGTIGGALRAMPATVRARSASSSAEQRSSTPPAWSRSATATTSASPSAGRTSMSR